MVSPRSARAWRKHKCSASSWGSIKTPVAKDYQVLQKLKYPPQAAARLNQGFPTMPDIQSTEGCNLYNIGVIQRGIWFRDDIARLGTFLHHTSILDPSGPGTQPSAYLAAKVSS
ncbi:MAG: hypothetical protein GX784_02080 [Firmicutes bacterium]|nr:hypothetical protein [Candidatus Fermentithermobacillaceae bacterium]